MATSFFGKLNPSRTQSNQWPKINIWNQRENTAPPPTIPYSWCRWSVGRLVGWLVTQLCGGRTAGLIQMLLTYVSKPDDTPSTKIDRYCPQTKTCHLSGMSTDVLTADLCRMTSNVFDFVGQLSGNTELWLVDRSANIKKDGFLTWRECVSCCSPVWWVWDCRPVSPWLLWTGGVYGGWPENDNCTIDRATVSFVRATFHENSLSESFGQVSELLETSAASFGLVRLVECRNCQLSSTNHRAALRDVTNDAFFFRY